MASQEPVIFDRVPPHDDAAEQAVLGGMLMSSDAIGEVGEILDISDFYQPWHQTIFHAIQQLYAGGSPVDILLIKDLLSRTGELEKVGGIDYLSSLSGAVPTAANAVYYAQVVHEKAILRNVISAGTKIAQMGYSSDGNSAEEIVNLAQSEVYEMGINKVRQDYERIGSIANETLRQIDNIQNNVVRRGVMTGFKRIDQVTQGLQPGQLIVVAGRPAMGKSTLGMDFARYAAFNQHITTIVFSLEMSKTELCQRILSAQTNIPLVALRRAELDPRSWGLLNQAAADFEQAPLYLDDSPNMSLMEIRAKCRRLKQVDDLGLVVIDYLQLMSSAKQVESRQQEVSEFSRALKLLAKELNIPVVALSQLNRGPEMRNDKRPMLSDLRESGSIEQDADVVFLVHRPDAYDKDDRPGEADIIMAKHRNGPTDTFTLAFWGSNSKFRDMPDDFDQQAV